MFEVGIMIFVLGIAGALGSATLFLTRDDKIEFIEWRKGGNKIPYSYFFGMTFRFVSLVGIVLIVAHLFFG